MYAPLRAAIGWRVQLVEKYWKGEAHARFPLTAERKLRYCWLNRDQQSFFQTPASQLNSVALCAVGVPPVSAEIVFMARTVGQIVGRDRSPSPGRSAPITAT